MALTGFEHPRIKADASRPANPKVLVTLFEIRIINLSCLSNRVVHGSKTVAAGGIASLAFVTDPCVRQRMG